jgi:RND family efflux transporter MFP subunit
VLAKLKINPSAKPVTSYASNKRYRHFLLQVTLIGMIVLGYFFYTQVLSPGFPVEISTVTMAYPSQALALFNATGYVVPQTKADIASKATGRLEWMGVEEGSRAQQGQIIARLENQDVIADMEQAAANVGVAKASLKQTEVELKEASLALGRAKNLIGKHFITPELYDAAVARYDKATAAVNSAKAAIVAADAAYRRAKITVEYTLIRAPFDGVILTKHADIGDVVAPFSSTTESKGAVVSMADLNTLEVETDVSESSLFKVRVGQPCEIQLDALPDTRFRGVVHGILPTVDRTKATVLVKVRFLNKDGRILPDMSAKVAFLSREIPPEQQDPVAVVKPSAIISRNGTQTAFLVRGTTVNEVSVETGDRIEDMVVVSKGLSSGDQVVLHPPAKLRDGSLIRRPSS